MMKPVCFVTIRKQSITFFFESAVAWYVWGVVACAFDLRSLPSKMDNLCDWVMNFKSNKIRMLIASGFRLYFGLYGRLGIRHALKNDTLLIL